MDKSALYIAMCRDAAELQAFWQQAYGDFFVDGEGAIRCWLPGKLPFSDLKKGVGIRHRGSIVEVVHYWWLPRLNQLIEMAQVPGKTYDRVTQEFFDWTKCPYPPIEGLPAELCRTQEQFWLLFFMQNRCHKVWVEDRWRPWQWPHPVQ